jgi:hypothetical protein
MQIYYQLLLNVVEAEKALDRANKDSEVSFLSAAGLGLEETAVSMISYVEAISAATESTRQRGATGGGYISDGN